ncbi:MAG: DUF1802 family protein [Phycisphaerales bacterium]
MSMPYLSRVFRDADTAAILSGAAARYPRRPGASPAATRGGSPGYNRGKEPAMMDVGLKEWSVVCDLLVAGKTAMLLRKGGISERSGAGVFELEHEKFVLFPSWLHTKKELLKPEHREAASGCGSEPGELTFRGFGEVRHIWRVPSRESLDSLDDLHCWTGAYLDQRWEYRRENPLFVMAVRAWRLPVEKTIAYRQAFYGCHSWVPLEEREAVDERGATEAMGEEGFAEVVRRIGEAMG